MLELRPSCEHCSALLPPASRLARICSFECTFCAACAERFLQHTCPNCAGDLVARPIRPAHDWLGDNSLRTHAATSSVRHRPADLARHAQLLAQLCGAVPEAR